MWRVQCERYLTLWKAQNCFEVKHTFWHGFYLSATYVQLEFGDYLSVASNQVRLMSHDLTVASCSTLPPPPPSKQQKIVLQASTLRPVRIQNTIWSLKYDFGEPIRGTLPVGSKASFPFRSGAFKCRKNGPSKHVHWGIRVRQTPKVLRLRSSFGWAGEPTMALKCGGRTDRARKKARWTH